MDLKKRYLKIEEATSLQGLNGLNYFPENSTRAFKALGNAVNSHIVKEIALNNFHRWNKANFNREVKEWEKIPLTIDAAPEMMLYKVLQGQSYDEEVAMSEFVDNSIQSFIGNKDAIIEKNPNQNFTIDIKIDTKN
ncbi:hypothetical protein [Abyssogena phaseoliformis symbiont]|uniref:hypothetical protein n=1 Tax=Abyssogena phaseoliformis symbiont TaxID=596095 RepID=UPI001915BBAE|nr:hypothetical protein [Abyssogena phaseoliformis symbiont]